MRHGLRLFPLFAALLFCLIGSNAFPAADYKVKDGQYYYHYLPSDDNWDWLGDCAVAWNRLVDDNTGDYDDNDYLIGYYVDSYDEPIRDSLPSPDNGYYEMAVFDSTQLADQGYSTWEEKPGNGICYFWWNGSQEIVEADIFVHPNAAAEEDQFRKTLTHEYGHALGLSHDERYFNIMYPGTWRQPPNHSSSWYTRMLDLRFLRYSLESVNSGYGEAVWNFQQWADVAVWSQTHENSGTTGDLIMTDVSPRTVAAGDDITFEHLHVENRGNLAAPNVRVTFYLSTNATISDQDYPIGWFGWDELAPEVHWSNGNYTFTVPNDIPAGDYYVGMVATSDADEPSSANDRAILTEDYYGQFAPIIITLTGGGSVTDTPRDTPTDTPTQTDTPHNTATHTPTNTPRDTVTSTRTPTGTMPSPTKTPTTSLEGNPGDFDRNGYVDCEDLWTLMAEWNSDNGSFLNVPGNVDPDMNDDDCVDACDVVMFIEYWHDRYSAQLALTRTPTATPTKSLQLTDYYISVTGSDSSGDGTTIAPWRSIQHAVDWVTTNALPDESAPAAFRISGGTYEENILLSDYIHLYGGYNSNWARDIEENKTYIDGDGQGSCVKCGDRELDEEGAQGCRLDGLYLVNGMGDGVVFTGEQRQKGGGLFCYNSSVTVEDCFFLKNKAQDRGGAIYMKFSSATVVRCVFENNESVEDDGGAIFTVDSSFLHLSNSSFHGNKTGEDGGGVYSEDTEIRMEDCSFSSNYAEEDGGAARCYSEGAVTVKDCSFINNYSDGYGGGVQLESVDGVDVSGCLISDNSARTGGGIFVEALGTISSCTISDNTARNSHGGGLFIDDNSGDTVNVSNCSITGNTTPQSGGGVYIKGENPTIANCSLYENSAHFSGAGIKCQYLCEPKIINCRIYRNWLGTTSFGAGGAGIDTTSASPLIAGCLIYDNTTEGSLECAGILCEYDSSLPRIVNCTIFNNKNVDFNRGNGVTISSEAVPTIVNTILWGNGLDIYPRYSESSPVVSYCCIESTGDDNEGTGVSHDNPKFVSPTTGDFHLQSGSPCRNTGLNDVVPPELALDLDGNTRISGTVDIGAYEQE